MFIYLRYLDLLIQFRFVDWLTYYLTFSKSSYDILTTAVWRQGDYHEVVSARNWVEWIRNEPTVEWSSQGLWGADRGLPPVGWSSEVLVGDWVKLWGTDTGSSVGWPWEELKSGEADISEWRWFFCVVNGKS